MKPDTPISELDSLQDEKDALDQSIALNRIVMTMLESKRREDAWKSIILVISLLVNIVIAGIFIAYEKDMQDTWTTTETTTVSQDTGEGSGNNVYQAGENANYNQGFPKEVTDDGETNGDSNQNNYKNEIEGTSDSAAVIPGR